MHPVRILLFASVGYAAALHVLPDQCARRITPIAFCRHPQVKAEHAWLDGDGMKVIETCTRCPARRVHNMSTGFNSPWVRVAGGYLRAAA